MKDKLLKLVEACIEDIEMCNNTKNCKDNNFINAYKQKTVLSSITKMSHKGDSLNVNGTAIYFHKNRNEKILICNSDRYSDTSLVNIYFMFPKQPQISISPVIVKTDFSQEQIKRVVGGFFRDTTYNFDTTVANYTFGYEIQCGSLKYPIDKEYAEALFDRIVENRKKHIADLELAELNERFKRFNIQ